MRLRTALLGCVVPLAIDACSPTSAPVVSNPLAVFKLTPAGALLAPGDQLAITPIVPDSLLSIAPSFTWSSDAPNVATVSRDGVVRAVGRGSVRITFGGDRAAGYSYLNVVIPDTTP